MKTILSLAAMCITAAQAVVNSSLISTQVDVTDIVEDTSTIQDHCCFFYKTENF